MTDARNTDSEGITEADLIARRDAIQNEKGSFLPQVLSTIAVCFGAATFGIIITWGTGATSHLEELRYHVYRPNLDYVWLTLYAPAGAAVGVVPWAFLSSKFGPRAMLILQSVFLLICWFLKAYFVNYKAYVVVHFFSGFCGVCYMFTGETYLVETVHRYYIKTLFTFFRTSFILGVALFAGFYPILKRTWMCVFGAVMTAISCGILCTLPESPVFLAPRSEPQAEKALKFYLDKANVSQELAVIRRFKVFLVTGAYNRGNLLITKVVQKTILIFSVLQLCATTTGYYAFLLDSRRIFTTLSTTVNPYVDNLIYCSVLLVSRLVCTKVNLRLPAGIKIPMLLSTGLLTVILLGLGTVCFYRVDEGKKNCILLLGMCLFGVTYEMGLGICPEMLLYDYTPYQVYDYLMKIMLAVHWAMVAVGVGLYMISLHFFGLHWTFWGMAAIAAAVFVFIIIFVVESKGKTLRNIQYALGGNSAGNRGSQYNRLVSPFEQPSDYVQFQNLIRAHTVQ